MSKNIKQVKKLILLLLLVPLFSFSQTWYLKTSDDPFDGRTSTLFHKGFGGEFPYQNPSLIIRYRHLNDKLEIYISDLGYSGCDDNTIIAAFNNNTENIKTYPVGASTNNDAVFFRQVDLIEFLSNLKKYSKVTIKFSNTCGDSRFQFNLNGSTKAINNLLNLTKGYNQKALALKEKERIEQENEAKKIDSKLSLLISQLNSLGLSLVSLQKIDDVIKKKLKVALILENFDDFKSVSLKPHPFFDLETNRQVKVFYKMVNDSLMPVDDKYYNLSVGNYAKEIQKNIDNELKSKFKKIGSIMDNINFKDFSYKEIKKNVESRIKYSKNSDWTYDSLFVKSCECDLFEPLGKVKLYLSRISKSGFRENLSILGDWYVNTNAPVKDEINKEIKYFNSLFDNDIITDFDLLRKNFKKDFGSVYEIKSIYVNPKRGKLTKSMFKSGGRELFAELKNGNNILLSKYVKLNTHEKN